MTATPTPTPTLIEPDQIKAAITAAFEEQEQAYAEFDLRWILTCQTFIDRMLDRLSDAAD